MATSISDANPFTSAWPQDVARCNMRVGIVLVGTALSAMGILATGMSAGAKLEAVVALAAAIALILFTSCRLGLGRADK